MLVTAGCGQVDREGKDTQDQSSQASDSSNKSDSSNISDISGTSQATGTSQRSIEKIVIEPPEEKKSDIQKISGTLAEEKSTKRLLFF